MTIKRSWMIGLMGSCLAALAMGQVTMQLVSPTGSGPVLGGVYISPYTALINGTPTLVICDDFETDVSLSTPAWQAYGTSVSSIQTEVAPNTVVKFDNTNLAAQRFEYGVAAYLAIEILQAQAANNLTAQGDLSFALWGLFDTAANGPFNGNWVTGADLTAAQNDLADAKSYVQLNNPIFSNVTVYSPAPKGASQEYIVVNTPEPPAMAVLGAEFSGLFLLVYAFRRRALRTVA